MIAPELERRILHLHNRYIRVIDDDRLEEWPALFLPEGNYRITTRENHDRGLPLALMSCQGRGMMHDRVTGLRKINVYEPHRYHHQIGGLEAQAREDGLISCISNVLVIRTMHTGAASIFASGIYQDLLKEDGDGELRFAQRHVVTDSRQTDTLLVIPI